MIYILPLGLETITSLLIINHNDYNKPTTPRHIRSQVYIRSISEK